MSSSIGAFDECQAYCHSVSTSCRLCWKNDSRAAVTCNDVGALAAITLLVVALIAMIACGACGIRNIIKMQKLAAIRLIISPSIFLAAMIALATAVACNDK